MSDTCEWKDGCDRTTVFYVIVLGDVGHYCAPHTFDILKNSQETWAAVGPLPEITQRQVRKVLRQEAEHAQAQEAD
jgi:hypothetical protein